MPGRFNILQGWLKSLLVHVAIAAAFVVTIEATAPDVQQASVETIKATVIDQADIDAAREAKAAEERRQREAERQRREAEAERRRQAELEEKRKAEAERQRKAEAERQRQAELEAKRKAEEEARRKAEAEAKRKAEEEARRQAEAEAKRKAEEEARRKAEAAARARREAEMEAAMQAEQDRLAAIKAGKQDEWISRMRGKAYRYFSPPPSVAKGEKCTVETRIAPGGAVLSARASGCGNELLARAAENAVLKADPLPMPEDPSVFERNIDFIFEVGAE